MKIATIRLGPTDYELAQGVLVEKWIVEEGVIIAKIQVGAREDHYLIGELLSTMKEQNEIQSS